MQIIFDSEKQMRNFIEELCPATIDFSLTELENKCCKECDDCESCWEKCGIELEVKKGY